jgi:hypothetical protein
MYLLLATVLSSYEAALDRAHNRATPAALATVDPTTPCTCTSSSTRSRILQVVVVIVIAGLLVVHAFINFPTHGMSWFLCQSCEVLPHRAKTLSTITASSIKTHDLVSMSLFTEIIVEPPEHLLPTHLCTGELDKSRI